MTPRQEFRHQFRAQLFERRGMAPQRAADLADALTARDSNGDDRHLCVECRSLTNSYGCRKRGAVVLDVLQRCESFEYETPK